MSKRVRARHTIKETLFVGVDLIINFFHWSNGCHFSFEWALVNLKCDRHEFVCVFVIICIESFLGRENQNNFQILMCKNQGGKIDVLIPHTTPPSTSQPASHQQHLQKGMKKERTCQKGCRAINLFLKCQKKASPKHICVLSKKLVGDYWKHLSRRNTIIDHPDPRGN